MEKYKLSNLVEVKVDHIIDLDVYLFNIFLFEAFAFFAAVIADFAFNNPDKSEE